MSQHTGGFVHPESSRPAPIDLWHQAKAELQGGSEEAVTARYHELLVEHEYEVPGGN